ncbi:Phosphodiesterase I [Bertholletia excelsa]
MRIFGFILLAFWCAITGLKEATSHGVRPLSRIAIHETVLAFDTLAYGQNSDWVMLEYSSPKPSGDDWIAVFSPANFSASTSPPASFEFCPPFLCTAPIKGSICLPCAILLQYQYANYTNPKYKDTGKGSLKLLLINQRSNFSFALFSAGFATPKLVAVSNIVALPNPNAPLYPRLAQGKTWNEMTVTWTSGYGINQAEPFVEWGPKGGQQVRSPAGTLTFDHSSMCGALICPPARTVGWRASGFIHTSFVKELWPNSVYTYKMGHRLFSGIHIWSQIYQFQASPYPGQNSVQCVIIFGDMGKYSTDYGMFRFCVADTEHDWREGSEQYVFIEHCLASVDRQKQPWLIFLVHWVLGYSSSYWYALHGSTGGPMGRDSLQKLWQKYKVDLAIFGHIHNYERTCPIYQNMCTSEEKHYYKGVFNGTIHVVAGGAGASLSWFSNSRPSWSIYRDYDYGFVKLTAFDRSNLLFEYKRVRMEMFMILSEYLVTIETSWPVPWIIAQVQLWPIDLGKDVEFLC